VTGFPGEVRADCSAAHSRRHLIERFPESGVFPGEIRESQPQIDDPVIVH
jgi:hypothetical protein